MSDKDLLRQFSAFLDKNIGLYYPKERWHDLEKKLILIKNSFGFENISDCLNWILKNPVNKETIDILTFHLTIGETYFFRDPQRFEILEQYIIPDILHRKNKERSIRLWSAGCCTGEEPYSVAILLHRLIPNIKNWKVLILGSDINHEFLLKAEKARYKKWSFRTTPVDIIENYFTKNKDGSFSLIPEIQKMVQFDYFNLVEDKYPNPQAGIHEMDLIFCHNVLIYFSENQIKKTVQKLSASLCNEGWLSVTAIETPFISEASLTSQQYPGAIFFKKEPLKKIDTFHSKISDTPFSPVKKQTHVETLACSTNTKPLPTKAKTVQKVCTLSDEDFYGTCQRLYQQKCYMEVIHLLQPYLHSFQNDPSAVKEHLKEIILLIRTYANQGDLASALKWSEIALKAEDLDPMLHYLQATLLQDQGHISEAINSVKRALFINSNFLMAYLLLGILEKQQGNKKAALRSFKTAMELIDHSPSEDFKQTSEDYTLENLRDLISNNLKNL